MMQAARSLIALTLALSSLVVHAGEATPVDRGVLVANNLEPDATPTQANRRDDGGYAVTGQDYIDVAVFSFRLEGVTSVSDPVLHLPVFETSTGGGSVPMQVFAYTDNGVIELGDFALGDELAIAEFSATTAGQTLEIPLRGSLNGLLEQGESIGLRVVADVAMEDIETQWRGIRIGGPVRLSYTPGDPGIPTPDTAAFDGHYLSLPGLSAPDLGRFDVTLELQQNQPLRFRLRSAPATDPIPPQPGPRSGTQLLECQEFSEPAGSLSLQPGQPDFNPRTGIVDIPRFSYRGQEYSGRLEFLTGSSPMEFMVLEVNEDPPADPPATIADLGTTVEVQPSRDFVPLCNGWVLIGDTESNSLIERNLITGETGNVYPFNTTPDQMTLDAANGVVYFTTQPRSERLYRLILSTGTIDHARLQANGRDFIPRELALGEDGSIFAVLFDPHFEEEEDPPAPEGLWMGVVPPSGELDDGVVPLESPVNIYYDPTQQHVFLRTESNLATFDFDPSTNGFTFVPDTDVPVGSGCTDFSISPDGDHLAYACPQGNDPDNDRTSLIDMSPTDYYDAAGEWILDSAPVSATFTPNGEKLLATDGEKLYRFDVDTHLRETTYEMNLPEEQSIKRIRVSRDGQFLLLLMQGESGSASGHMHWMRLP